MIRRTNSGFSLIEILIVLSIMGIMLSIAVPNFAKSREISRTKACISNLMQIQSAKEQWAMDNKKGSTDTPSFTDLVGGGKYIYSTTNPTCPSNGTYTMGNVGTLVTCTYTGHTL